MLSVCAAFSRSWWRARAPCSSLQANCVKVLPNGMLVVLDSILLLNLMRIRS